MELIFVIGRVLLGGYFLKQAYNHFKNVDRLTGYARSKGVEMPKASVIISGLLLSVGGVSLVLGLWPQVGIAALVLFLIPVTYMMHAFWKINDPMARQMEEVKFMKNLALLGALIMLLAIPLPWVASLNF